MEHGKKKRLRERRKFCGSMYLKKKRVKVERLERQGKGGRQRGRKGER